MTSALFGNKMQLAIELGYTKTPQKYKLRFWVKGRKIGGFTKAGELTDSVKEYKKFISSKEKYYLPVFDHLSPTRIFYYLTDMSLLISEKDEDLKEFDRRRSFYLFFGKQFTNDTSSLLLLYKDGQVIFLYSLPKTGKVKDYSISLEVFCKVFDGYIEYCITNNLL